MPNENLSKRVNEIVEKADDLLSRIDKMTDESIEAEFRKIWKMIRELIFDIILATIKYLFSYVLVWFLLSRCSMPIKWIKEKYGFLANTFR